MSLYLDSSVVVAALVREAASARVQTWLLKQGASELAISDWVETEVASALSLKVRMGTLTAAHRAEAAAAFSAMIRDTLQVLPVGRMAFRTAARFLARHELGVRSGDALHLAICAERGDVLCTLDQVLLRAGLELGVRTLEP